MGYLSIGRTTPEIDELINQLEDLDERREAGELGFDEAAEQMNRLRAEHPEASAFLRREAEARYQRTGRRHMAFDEAATPKDRAVNNYHSLCCAVGGVRRDQRTLVTTLAALSEAQLAELDPDIITAAGATHFAMTPKRTRKPRRSA